MKSYTTIVPFNTSEYYHKYCTIGSSDFGPDGNPWIVQVFDDKKKKFFFFF